MPQRAQGCAVVTLAVSAVWSSTPSSSTMHISRAPSTRITWSNTSSKPPRQATLERRRRDEDRDYWNKQLFFKRGLSSEAEKKVVRSNLSVCVCVRVFVRVSAHTSAVSVCVGHCECVSIFNLKIYIYIWDLFSTLCLTSSAIRRPEAAYCHLTLVWTTILKVELMSVRWPEW